MTDFRYTDALLARIYGQEQALCYNLAEDEIIELDMTGLSRAAAEIHELRARADWMERTIKQLGYGVNWADEGESLTEIAPGELVALVDAGEGSQ